MCGEAGLQFLARGAWQALVRVSVFAAGLDDLAGTLHDTLFHVGVWSLE